MTDEGGREPCHHPPSLICLPGHLPADITTIRQLTTMRTLLLTLLGLTLHTTLACIPLILPPQPTTTISSSSSSSSSSTTTSTPSTTTTSGEEVTYLDCKCGVPQENRNRIVGGQPADKSEYPWQVALKWTGSRKPFCGGSILSSDTILTAAHCEGSIGNMR